MAGRRDEDGGWVEPDSSNLERRRNGKSAWGVEQ